MKQQISLNINGEVHEILVKPQQTLLEVLRVNLGMTGTKLGCDTMKCGACTVLIDGKATKSCKMPAVKAQGKEICTIEGLEQNGQLHPLQKAFIKHGAIQCGFCTPGMIMRAKSLLDKNPQPGDEEIKKALSDNICRCTGYVKIIEAVKAAAEEIRQGAMPF